MTIRNLQALVNLVNEGKINLIGFYYPVVAPSLKLKWTALYQDKDLNDHAVGEFDIFLMACEGLISEFFKSEASTELSNTISDAEILDANSYIEKIVEFIKNELIAEKIKPVWLFGLEYSNELRDNPVWIAVLEGDVYLEMQIMQEDTSLSKVSEYIYKETVKLKNS
jgi:hypothetical protein